MTTRSVHRALGIVMLAPLFAWAVTGAIFFIKPGYGGAYESLAVRTYPVETSPTIPTPAGWKEIRFLRTVLGDHLLVRTDQGWRQIDPVTAAERPSPTDIDIRRLMTDAFAANPTRYGSIASVAGNQITTDTGVRVTFDWNRMALAQRGVDTDRIDAIYKVHYLQWTGIEWIDRVLGGLGLILLVALSIAGVRLLLSTRRGVRRP